MPELVPSLPFSEELLLLNEVNHRIINEFASLIGIVSLAAAGSANDEVKRALSGVARLLHDHAEVHHSLRLPDRQTLVDAEGYLRKLCRSIRRSKLDRMNIDLVLAAPLLPLESGGCWRLGMIVNELITNAARHAFGGRPGKIRVELFRGPGFVKCAVSDNGTAPAHIQAGRGLRIVEELAKALDGHFERKLGPAGTTSILIFPYSEPKKASSADGACEAGGEEHRTLRTDHASAG
jgi:two-component sensor histidine kinase